MGDDGASVISLLTFNLLLMRLGGYIGVAAYGVIANTPLVATSIFTGVGQGIQPLASRVFGANDGAGMRRLLSYTRLTVTALSLIIFAAVFLFAQPLAGAFNHEGDAQLLHIAVSGLRVYFTGYLFAGVNIAAAALLSRLLGVTGVWLSFVVTEAACCALSLCSVRAAQRG